MATRCGVIAERLTKAGAKDEGDMVVIISGETYILELKNRQTLSLPEFWREAQVEALNYAKARGLGEVPLSYVVVKRRNASIDQAGSWVIKGEARPSPMDKGETIMPVPEGNITTSDVWSKQMPSIIKSLKKRRKTTQRGKPSHRARGGRRWK
jgi:hypothetical protein